MRFFGIKYHKNLKIGASYSAFDGLENIEASLNSIRKNVDYINVVYQDISYKGKSAAKKDLDYLKKLVQDKLIDKIIIYTCDLNFSGHINEVRKRDLGVQDLKEQKCSYILIMDCDECYNSNQFEKSKQFIINNKITSSACLLYYYLQKPNYRFATARELYVPFLQKLYKNSHIVCCDKQYCLVDPTRLLNQKRRRFPYVFGWNFLVCHHFAYIRLDLKSKFDNSSTDNVTNETIKIRKKFIKDVINYKYPNKFTLFNGDVYNVVWVKDDFNVKQSYLDYLNFIKK